MAVWLRIVSLAVAAVLAGRVHIVEAGESLCELATRYCVSVQSLRQWNHLPGDTIRVGQVLAVTEPVVPDIRRQTHVVLRGETLGLIAQQHGVTVARILALNPRLDPDVIRRGVELVVDEGPMSESIGSPMAGAIEGAVQLPPHASYVLRNQERAYGTRRTITRIQDGFDAMARLDPDAPRVRIHDLSLPLGGPIDDHQTHQSGRDVDITYYQVRGCTTDAGCPLRDVAPAELDVARQWRLLAHWLRRGEVEVIYMDYALQPRLYREAQRTGASSAELERWFQYPRSRGASEGRIRHRANHINHVHVRFACHHSEPQCH